jgi:hypothetical protein
MKNACIFISTSIFFYLNETWEGGFLCTVDDIVAIYITSAIFPCMVSLGNTDRRT